METYFIVTVDTEEMGLWSQQFQAIYDDTEHIREIPVFQKICDKYGVLPSYLMDYPIIKHTLSSRILKEIYKDGKCEIGAHMHPWCTPPYEEDRTIANSYFHNLDPQLQEAKLGNLTAAIKDNFGINPVVFRSGRFGFSESQALLLRKFGYLVDSSIIPFMDYRYEGGPDFEGKPFCPYWINTGDNSGPLLEIPVSVGFNRANFKFCSVIFKNLAENTLARKVHLIGILDTLTIMQKIVFSPENSSLNRLKSLSRIYTRKNLRVLNMYLHSSSFVPGGTPYVRSDKDLKLFLAKLDNIFDFLINNLGVKNITLDGYRTLLSREEP